MSSASLKRASDVLLVLALVVAVLALVTGPRWLFAVAGVLLVAAVQLTRQLRARRRAP